MNHTAMLPPLIVLDPLLQNWLREDIGRGDWTSRGLLSEVKDTGQAVWIARASGRIVGLPVAARVFQLLDSGVNLAATIQEGERCDRNQVVAHLSGPLEALLTGERVALNIVMHLSGIATLTRQFVEKIADLPVQLVDTRKTTPGLRLLEKYASRLGGAINHRMGLDDATMIKDNHIVAAGGLREAITRVRLHLPFPTAIEVETETLNQVEEALQGKVNIIMLDNMPLDLMRRAVELVRQHDPHVTIEASGNITLETIRAVAETGVDYISSSSPITRSTWLDISMRLENKNKE